MSLKDLLAKMKGNSSKERPEENEEDKPKVVNGYLQTSNTRVIRPVYSNTSKARKAQEQIAEQKRTEKT